MATKGIAVGEKCAQEQRVNRALTAEMERRALVWMAERAPRWVTSDGLTVLGLAAHIGAGACYAMARFGRGWLAVGIACIALNWLGDSLDGTLARVRRQQRPKYGFYVDHMADVLGAAALMGGLALSGLAHPATAAAMLVAFLVLSAESYLAAHTLGAFEMSKGIFGPTEIRLLLIAGNLELMRTPWATVFGRRVLLFDLGGWIAVAGMSAMALWVTAQHTAELYRREPLGGGGSAG